MKVSGVFGMVDPSSGMTFWEQGADGRKASAVLQMAFSWYVGGPLSVVVCWLTDDSDACSRFGEEMSLWCEAVRWSLMRALPSVSNG